jgi:hypothetical protein
MVQIPDEKLISELIQDMRVKLRDMDDFSESIHYKTIIKKFQEGFEKEYSQS